MSSFLSQIGNVKFFFSQSAYDKPLIMECSWQSFIASFVNIILKTLRQNFHLKHFKTLSDCVLITLNRQNRKCTVNKFNLLKQFLKEYAIFWRVNFLIKCAVLFFFFQQWKCSCIHSSILIKTCETLSDYLSCWHLDQV